MFALSLSISKNHAFLKRLLLLKTDFVFSIFFISYIF